MPAAKDSWYSVADLRTMVPSLVTSQVVVARAWKLAVGVFDVALGVALTEASVR